MKEIADAQADESADDQLADAIAPTMFYLSLTYLAMLAGLMVLWIDVPRVAEFPLSGQTLGSRVPSTTETPIDSPIELDAAPSDVELLAFHWGAYLGAGLLLIWPVFVMEQAAHFLLMRRGDAFARVHPNWWLFCIAPPARLCARHRRNKQLIWFPRWGWQIVDRALQRRLERAFSVPMICIALLILPVLGLQAYYSERIVAYPVLNAFLHFGTGLIWFAFAVEFIVMVSVAERRLDYCRKHWLDLIIILLPLVSFLRTLSFARASRLIKLGKLQQVTRLVRVYRVRGVAMRGFRALLLLEIVHRLLRTDPKKRIKKLEEKYNEKLHELEILRHDIEQLRRKIEH